MGKEKTETEERNHLAALCSMIMQKPEQNIKYFKGVFAYLTEENHSNLTKKLALLSAAAVLKDIIPGYRIRELTEVEKNTVLTKEVKELRDFEQSILKNFKYFLRLAEQFLKDPLMSFSSLKALCDLLISVKHFNFHPNIIAVVVPFMDSSSDQLSSLAHRSVSLLIKDDLSAESSLLIVRSICDLVKKKSYNTKPNILDLFFELKIDQILNASERLEKQVKKRSEKKVTKKGEEKDIERQMEEAETAINKREVQTRQKEILKFVFVTYFRIIKRPQHESVLLPSVLQGFARFAHLISIEVVHDLLQVLKSFIASSSTSSLENKLEATLTAFEVVKHQETLNVDFKDFYNHFYSILNDLHLNPTGFESQRREMLTLKVLTKLFIEPKKLPIERVAGFLKRLSILSLGSNFELTISILVFMHRIFEKYPKTTQLVDGENAGSGVFLYESEDPEHSNSFSATLAEFIPLTRSVHPMVSSLTKELVRIHALGDSKEPQKVGKMEQKAKELLSSGLSLEDIYSSHNFIKSGNIQPFAKEPIPHPLIDKINRDKKRSFFIQNKYDPNATEFGRSLSGLSESSPMHDSSKKIKR